MLLTQSFDRGERRRLAGFFGSVGLLHLLGWGLLLAYGASHPGFVWLGGVAYMLGLRHAFDADHISAIDNTTRRLLQGGQKPIGVGFFFSLGHSTVVFVVAVALGLAVKWIVQGVVGDGGELRSIGGAIGTSVSGAFLVLIGILNLLVLVDLIRVYRRMRNGEYDRQGLEHELTAGGLMTRIFGRLFRVIEHSWQMYPIGFLFGLGFDTASEVAFLAVSAGAAAQGLPFAAIISLPLIFAAGMSLMDTMDGAFMSKAYSWAFSSPIRKVFYNLTITSLSVFVALFIGVVELMQILTQVLGLHGAFFDQVARFNFLGVAGYVIVAAFVITWGAAFVIYKVRRIDERWSAAVDKVA
ncbi:MAG: HoxN/HupN/NixA family nickel/cobalt transporter [Chloroflexi bacterium]|nr:MAG: HoxN/HupN/NixA family nickel/cobalt transporter [Chloroflexota bacterium]TMF35161.1 MAG: HoxN/HupN/NixA family nickel/cobalt transporter [Chloroflexota bacterium]